MRTSATVILSILASALIVGSCIDAPSFEEIPEISNARLQLSGNPVNPADSGAFVLILFDFKDGDGDIGRAEGDTTSENLFLENSQLDTTFVNANFSIPYIPPSGGVPDISGTVTVQFSVSTITGFCLAKPSLTQLEYRLWIRDRAGNMSNILDLPPIPIECN